MSREELCWTSARDLARMIRAKDVSPVEVIDATLDRVERVNPRINAYVTVSAEEARTAARDAETAIARGENLGPLHGVPYSIKDLTPTKGVRTTMGSKIFEHNVPTEDALLVQRLRDAGGILLGKTNTPEFGCKPATDNVIFGPTRNPWALEHGSGGSSGGAAAAVAAGLGPLAEGSDLAGSIRHPAAWCGAVGFKPSQGRIPRYPNLSAWSGMSVNGPITRSVGDAALMFAAMVGPDPRDPLALPDTGEDWAALVDGASVRGLRAAWTPDLGGATPMDPAVAGVARAAAQAFGDLGCTLDEASPEIGDIQHSFTVLNAGLRQATLGAYLDRWRDQMDPVLVSRIELSHGFSAVDVGRAELARSQYHHRLCRFFEQYDLLLLPATATPPLPLGTLFPPEIAGRPIAQHLDMLLPTFAFNFSCFPAISVPAGVTADGLPIGLQIVGGWQQDALVLRAAAAFEAARPWNNHRPPLD